MTEAIFDRTRKVDSVEFQVKFCCSGRFSSYPREILFCGLESFFLRKYYDRLKRWMEDETEERREMLRRGGVLLCSACGRGARECGLYF